MEKVILVVVSILVGLGISEAALRLVASDLAGEPTTGNQYLFYQFDPVLGWANKPGTKGVFKRKEFSYDVSINSDGLRGPERSRTKPDGVKRIAVLGDSFTWGIGASDDDLYVNLLEKKVPGSEVLNFGVSGYGPVHFHLLTEKVLAFSPDAVVLSFCLGNDFIDSVMWQRYRYYKPYAELDKDGKLKISGYPLPNVKRFPSQYEKGVLHTLYNWSYIYRLLDRHILGLVGKLENFGQKGLKLGSAQKEFYATPNDPEVQKAVAINAALMREIAGAYQARGIPVIVLAIPTKCELGKCFPDLTEKNYATLELLKQSLQGIENVTLVDPSSELGIDDYWDHDGHWRPAGNKKVADKLAPAVQKVLSGN
jgi:hypothetical protein